MNTKKCRSCNAPLETIFCDLGLSPISNAFIKLQDTDNPEVFYPLKACVCKECWLVQLESSPDSSAHFHEDYVYFSSFSEGWLKHSRNYAEMVVERFKLNGQSHVIEVASNDGYLLQNFVASGIPCLGIEPTANTAKVARAKGIETREVFFGLDVARQLVDEGKKADLLLGNNVFAHVPDINDFVSGMSYVLKNEGVITLEFPHLLELVQNNQFDTIYHEHYSYLSLIAILPIFSKFGLRVFEVEQVGTHGGSLRVYACHDGAAFETSPSVNIVHSLEISAGLNRLSTYIDFADKAATLKRELLGVLIEAKNRGKSVACYGAAAKGNTLLNYCGIGTDFIDFVVDKNETKQNRLLPGSRIPVLDPKVVFEKKPDYLLILPWNIKDEVMFQMADIRDWGGRFIVPIPKVEILL